MTGIVGLRERFSWQLRDRERVLVHVFCHQLKPLDQKQSTPQGNGPASLLFRSCLADVVRDKISHQTSTRY